MKTNHYGLPDLSLTETAANHGMVLIDRAIYKDGVMVHAPYRGGLKESLRRRWTFFAQLEA